MCNNWMLDSTGFVNCTEKICCSLSLFFKVFSMVKTKWFSIKTNGFQVYLFLLAIAYVHGQWNICNFSQAKSLNFIAYVLVQAWLKSTFKKRKVILVFLKFNYVNLDLSRLSLNENKIACSKVKLSWARGLFFVFHPEVKVKKQYP